MKALNKVVSKMNLSSPRTSHVIEKVNLFRNLTYYVSTQWYCIEEHNILREDLFLCF